MIRTVVRIAAVAVLAAAAGCANLEAVRDFTATSTQLTGYRDVTDRYLTTAQRRLAELPPDPMFDNQRPAIEATGTLIAEQKASLYALHALSTGYMGALAKLAGSDTYKVSGEIDAVAGSIKAFPDLDIAPRHVNAVAGLVKKVTSWALAAQQASDVKGMVQEYGPAMDTVLEAMENVLRNYAGVFEQERQMIRSFDEGQAGFWARRTEAELASPDSRRRNLMVLTLARRSQQVMDADQKRVETSLAAARRGVKAVREGHRTMLDNVDQLGAAQMKALLEKAYADLKSARSDLQNL